MTVCAQRGCNTPLNRNTAVVTRGGPMCRKHADRLPAHLRRVGRLTDAQREALARLGRTTQTTAAPAADQPKEHR